MVAVLLDRHGRTFAAEAGIPLRRNTPSPLFRLACLSLLISARIRSTVAMAAARAVADAGWTTARALVTSTWEERTEVLNQAGYARYDESTARYLGHTARSLLDRYDGDLRRLRESARGDPAAIRDGLTECKGIGAVGANFFLREVQSVWTELDPFVDDRTLRGARALGLSTDADGLRALVDDVGIFTQLVAAIVRTGIGHETSEILRCAATA